MFKTFFSKVAGITTAISVFVLPFVATAQVVVYTAPLRTFLNQLIGLFNSILPFLIVIVVILLIVWAFQFAVSAGDEEKRKAARDKIVWGLVGLVLLTAMYGIARIFTRLVPSEGGAGSVLPDVTIIPTITQ